MMYRRYRKWWTYRETPLPKPAERARDVYRPLVRVEADRVDAPTQARPVTVPLGTHRLKGRSPSPIVLVRALFPQELRAPVPVPSVKQLHVARCVELDDVRLCGICRAARADCVLAIHGPVLLVLPDPALGERPVEQTRPEREQRRCDGDHFSIVLDTFTHHVRVAVLRPEPVRC